jgi:hypothetical protein
MMIIQKAVKMTMKARQKSAVVDLIEIPLLENEHEGFTTQDLQSLHEADL